jgi:predicted acyltransferase
MKKAQNPIPSTMAKPPSARLMSLDALRGLDMFFLVGFSSIFRALPKLSDNVLFQFLADQCHHPNWHGFTAWDQIFPLFIFMMGVAMPFSFAGRLERGEKNSIYKHVAIRAAVLFFLGLVYWGNPLGSDNYGWGYYSVLYRIGFSYFFASLIVLNCKARGQALWAFGLMSGYFLAMRFIPVPGFGAGDFSQEGNLATFVTGWFEGFLPVGTEHLLSLTLIGSVANALFGALAGQWLRSGKSPNSKAGGLLIVGLLFIACGLLIHLSFPICKKLMSTSFTFLTCGISMILLGSFYWIIDVKGYRKWALFFVVVGMNSITIYLATRYVDFGRLASVFVGGFPSWWGPAGPLVLAIATAALMWLFLYFLYRRKIFLKV